MLKLGALETRSFEARFGDRCPFCGETWGSPKRCDPNPADYTIRDSLRLLFADRASNCAICGRQIETRFTYCIDCSKARERQRQSVNRHAWVTKTCEHCGSSYETQHPERQRFCSLSCGNKNRFAPRGVN